MVCIHHGEGLEAASSSQSDSYIYTPEGFDPEKYGGVLADRPDAARWFLSSIYMRRLLRNYDKDTYINLHSRLLGMVMGDMAAVRPVRKALVDHGLVECDYEWSEGYKSLGYRLGPVLRDVTWRRYSSPSKRFSKRVRKFKDHLHDHGVTVPVRQHLINWCRKVTFSSDLGDVLKTLPETPYTDCEWANKRAMASHQVEMIRGGYLSFTPACSYGRFHSNFTSLCGELRRCLTIDGEPLYEVDVTNSQPYFLSMLLLELHLSGGNCSSNLSSILFDCSGDHSLLLNSATDACNDEKNKEEKEREGIEKRTQPYVFGLMEMETTPMPPDLREMIKSTTEGKFYERFQRDEDDQTRDDVKKKVFQTIFGETKLMLLTPLGKVFKSVFPTAFDQMLALKRQKGHAWIGQELQRRESHLIINTVCERLRCDHSQIPIVTVHDSILTTQEHLETVKTLLERAFGKYAIPPRFKVKEPVRTGEGRQRPTQVPSLLDHSR